VAGHSAQFTPGGYLSTVIHTTLAGLERTIFQLLVLPALHADKAGIQARKAVK